MAGIMKEDVYCTLVMSDSYLPGAAILARSLRDCGTSKKLAALITIDSLLPSTIKQLRILYDYVLPVERLANPNLENLVHLNRLDLRFAFTKIALWKLEQFRKIVYLDADIVALRAPDELFDLPVSFAGAPDVGWPDCFNTGVMVLNPNIGEYYALQTLAANGSSFDGADQGLLNEYFVNRPWHRLSFTYNCTPNASYQYEPAYRHFRSGISLVHFIGKDKPWMLGKDAMNSIRSAGVYKDLLGRWWTVYDRHYKIATSAYSSSQREEETRIVRQYVQGEHTDFGWAAAGQSADSQSEAPSGNNQIEPPEASAVIVEPQLTDQGQPELSVGQEKAASPPKVHFSTSPPKVHFSAPHMDWDATRSEPPLESKPEAANFPSEHYEMSHDRSLFQAPQYSAPPKDLPYQIPGTRPRVDQIPRPIFPWEEDSARPKPTRIFVEDYARPIEPESTSEPIPVPISTPTSATVPEPSREEKIRVLQEAANLAKAQRDSYSQFNRTNAWDEVPSIDMYVRAVKDIQARRGKVQVLHQSFGGAKEDVLDFAQTSPQKGRRESLILTDFPTEIERPSLPVTPAPIRRPTFWGEERDDSGGLPAAQGVPEQADWVCPRCGFDLAHLRQISKLYLHRLTEHLCAAKNPLERLEELRRASLIAPSELPLSPTKEIPSRDMPANAAPLPQTGLASSPPAASSPPNNLAETESTKSSKPTYFSTTAT